MRKFSTYEINQLIKYGFDPIELSKTLNSDVPIEYITNKIEFCCNIFQINKNVLIPRIETEEIIELSKKYSKVLFKLKNSISFADIGTGSGVIGLSYIQYLKNEKIKFNCILSDISVEALEVCKVNTKSLFSELFNNNDEYNSIKIIQSNLMSNYSKDSKFDIIFANLPYIPTKRIQTLQSSLKDFEPHIALDGGKDGLRLISIFLNQAYNYINRNGILILEVDDFHTDVNKFNQWNINLIKDSNNKNRFWVAKIK